MNLIIFIDNNTFRLNSVIFSYIKRLLLYEIISSEYHNSKYTNILLYKTNPSLIKIKLDKINESDNKINAQDIIINFNNVIYKIYDTYGTLNFKKIIDEIYHLETDNTDNRYTNPDNNKIIVITSINNEYNFTELNISHLNELFKKIKSNIEFINISNYKFLSQIFPTINEHFIDIKNFKIENIFNTDDCPFKYTNLLYGTDELEQLINKLDFCSTNNCLNEEQNELIKTNETNNSNIILEPNKLTDLIILFGYIEVNINDIKTNSIELDKISKITEINIETGNTHLNNIIKSIKNSINDTVSRLSDTIIKLPTNTLEPFLSETYIKYILEFYEIVYPKIFKYNNLIDSHKKYNKKNYTELSQIKIKQIDNIKNDDNISTQYLQSTLSLTNWIEEYLNYNPFGFLIKHKPNKLSYKGILDIGSSIFKTYPNMTVEQVTTNWVSMYDYYQIVLTEFDNKNNDNNENNNNNNQGQTDTFNIGNFNIIDNIQGDGNIFLPVYINKKHWELTKSLWTYHMSFINNCFEFEYNKKMDNIYFYTILKIFGDLKNIGQNQNTKSSIRLFCYLIRTCIQILVDNKYLHSIKKDYLKFFELVLKTDFFQKNTIFSDWIVRLIQLIISNECVQTELETNLTVVSKYIFNNYIIENYKIDFWDIINDPNTKIEDKNQKLDDLKRDVLQANAPWLYLEHDLKIFNKLIKSIYRLKGFNQFIKTLDLTNGCVVLDDNTLNPINLINIEQIIKQICMEQFNLDYYQVDVSKYLM